MDKSLLALIIIRLLISLLPLLDPNLCSYPAQKALLRPRPYRLSECTPNGQFFTPLTMNVRSPPPQRNRHLVPTSMTHCCTYLRRGVQSIPHGQRQRSSLGQTPPCRHEMGPFPHRVASRLTTFLFHLCPDPLISCPPPHPTAITFLPLPIQVQAGT